MQQPKGLRLLVVVGAPLVALRLLLMLVVPLPPYTEFDGDSQYYYEIAKSLLASGRFLEYHLKAYRPPGFPVFMAANLWAFGESTRALQLSQNLLFLVAAAALAYAAAHAFNWPCGLIAALLFFLNPQWYILSQSALSEPLFACLFGIGMVAWVKAVTAVRGQWMLLAGAFFGLCSLTREVGLYVAVVAGLALWIAFFREGQGRIGTRLAVLFGFGLALTILPWTVRNALVLHRFVPISTNGPINVYMGNNPEATGYFRWALPPDVMDRWNRSAEDGGAEMLAYDRSGAEAAKYIREHPERFLSLTVKRFALFMLPANPGPIKISASGITKLLRALFWIPYLLLGIYGLYLSRRSQLATLIIVALVVSVVIQSLTYFDIRYRALVEYVLTVPAAYALVELYHTIKGVIPT